MDTQIEIYWKEVKKIDHEHGWNVDKIIKFIWWNNDEPFHVDDRPLNKSLSNSVELKSIENDYIKNLQQQVYFLELEANYLREQAKKATDMHPKMTAEAERMLYKLRVRYPHNYTLTL